MNKEMMKFGLHMAALIAPDFTLKKLGEHMQRPKPYPTRIRERVVLAQALEFKIPFGSQKVTGWSWGTSPRQVLLLHGWGGRGIQLRHFIAPLLAQGYRVVVIDFPAHGDSQGERTHLWEWVQVIQEVCKHWGPFDGAIGHSFGGTALTNALRRGAPIGRASLVAPMGNLPVSFDSWLSEWDLTPPLRRLVQEGFSELVGVEMEDLSPQHFALELKTPVLLVHDTQDPDIPHSQSDQLKQKWYGAKLLSTENLGHFKILKDPKVINEIIGFISQAEEEVA
ncbi:MAG: alpha/beta hydrolase [Bdellovibrionaceae bacterium]|nr:alpha/beta hydrolase [Bdellovibrionales bacterium]MCB9084120.1 alpha/beta hydrolase [Pseudobdellovibrionaceae bacterium]